MGIGSMTGLIPLVIGTLTPRTPTMGSLLNPASGGPADSPSFSQAALAGGRTARPWNQVARELAEAEKAAVAMAGRRTAQGSRAEKSVGKVAYPRYMGPDIKSADPLPLTYDTSGGNIPSFLLPLPTNIDSLGHLLPRRDGQGVVE